MDFKELHYNDTPLLLGNVWDVPGAKIFEKLKYHAIGTSSAAIAHMLGYDDGEQIPFSELQYVVNRIISSTSLPVSVDIENGYGRDAAEVVENIKALHQLGIAGINIEDSVIDDQGSRQLLGPTAFSEIITAINRYKTEAKNNLFVNVRTDAFLIGIDNALEETLNRLPFYENAGADGIFVPCIELADDINKVVKATRLPVNVMCMPNLPGFEELQKLGVKRISMGNFLHQAIGNQLEQRIISISANKSFKPVF
ncbi:isocitrate lyase/phosphoenolpyruvate mutase family protein [Fulvivirga kasyanovii]|uniref:Isocitrate lyase/phosphoenolpyruvate mutase family protein n=1 Tax=Fulvivirga kasyanovii TaxID=396812 RepID=A0ABW9RIH9_9BACT|nr:isocitrate lyase/phosphoenolpyruvate mutase family protein [Fulvivirga kasyanovii]MTI23796.1 isocitrate lyase/phosphoenolpyruvate mutase family protein [Fulvivirga kasyanovii]